MILLVDAGNTRIKWRVISPGEPLRAVDEGALAHEAIGELAAICRRHAGLGRVFGCNVAGIGVANAIAAACGPLAVDWLHPGASCCGVRNLYEQPAQLGADRWAALIGARQTHAHACLVVTAGTATTVDLLSAAGDFLGGLILPGVDLMQQSLARGTAQLPLADGHFALQPRRTIDAIRSGCLQAQAGAVERMFCQIADAPGATCLLGGGAAASFADLLGIPLRRIDNLVLLGLGAIAGAAALTRH
ncbi:MAG TPA: type III pantothenate kinase [Thauera sp.]|uniref:type III pantothenate kinase n=1 Tax=Thauera sp. TaxID=1905334 RepID=UPI002CAD226C|nr:type III pantothenate kinase [Thauera sp.]HRP25218.1 type III pantothenate kinase [Thauera sp.]HRP64588.1 type III pantothenate kinase [Thauera sp.]